VATANNNEGEMPQYGDLTSTNNSEGEMPQYGDMITEQLRR